MTSTAIKHILLTGVSRGLGRALLAGFAARGHTVWGCARSAAAVAELRRCFPALHRFAVVDVGSDAEVAAWAGELCAGGGAPDLVVNNAAVISPNAPLWQVPAETLAEVLRVNVAGTVNVIRHFVPAMIGRGRGLVVNFSSYWGRSAAAEVAPYCASKWAVEGLTRALAEELPAGLAAVALNPGIIDTAMLRSCFGASAGSYLGPAEWAEAAVPYILGLGTRESGQALTVPGQ